MKSEAIKIAASINGENQEEIESLIEQKAIELGVEFKALYRQAQRAYYEINNHMKGPKVDPRACSNINAR